MSDDQPDWPPQASASDLREGTVKHGSTGQRWQVQGGQWVRIKRPKLIRESHHE